MEEKMNVKDLLQMTVEDLEKIMVPVAYANEISRPLCQAVANIRACIEAFSKAPNEEKEGDVEDGVSG